MSPLSIYHYRWAMGVGVRVACAAVESRTCLEHSSVPQAGYLLAGSLLTPNTLGTTPYAPPTFAAPCSKSTSVHLHPDLALPLLPCPMLPCPVQQECV